LINDLKTRKKLEKAEKERLLTSNPISRKNQKLNFCSC